MCCNIYKPIKRKSWSYVWKSRNNYRRKSIKFYASVRIDIRRIDSIKQGDAIIGNRTRVKITKNKVAPPFKQAEFDIMYNEGISRTGNILDVGVKEEIVQKSGAWFSYGDIRLGQGRENAKDYI